MFRSAAALAAAMMFAAGSAQAEGLQVSYSTDAALDCPGITAELSRMDQVIAESGQKIAGADGQARGAGLAGTVAVEGMLRSGLLGRAPGLGGLANQAAAAAKRRAEAQKVAMAEQIRVAETRKALMAGLYSGKGCDAPAPAAPAPTETVAAASPAGI